MADEQEITQTADTSAPSEEELVAVLSTAPEEVGGADTTQETAGQSVETPQATATDTDVDDGSFREIMAQRGFSDLAAMPSDADAFEAFSQRARESQQQQEVVRWGQWALQNIRDIERQRLEAEQWRQWQSQQAQQAQWQAQQAAQQPQQPPENPWKAPEYDPGWLNLVREVPDPNNPGQTIWVSQPGALPDLPQKIATYQRWLSEQQQKLWQDPGKFVMELISPQVERMANERAQQAVNAFAQQQQQIYAQQQQQAAYQQQHQQAAQLIQSNLNWLVQCDDKGQPIRNPYTNTFTPTAEGKRFSELVQHGQRLGITNDNALWEFARASLLAELSQSAQPQGAAQQPAAAAQAAPQDLATQAQANKNMDFLRRSQTRAAKSPRGRAPAAQPTAPANGKKNKDFRDFLRAAMAENNLTEDSAREDDVLQHLVA